MVGLPIYHTLVLKGGLCNGLHGGYRWDLAREMGILEHIDELRRRFMRIIITIAVITVVSLTMSIKEFTLWDYRLMLPFPDPTSNVSAQIINKIRADMVPPGVELIVTAPGQALLAQLQMSMFLGVILGMPVIVWELSGFVGPALYSHEKKLIAKLLVPSTILFGLGIAFSYVYMTPFTLRFLYDYAVPLNARLFVTVDELLGFVLLFLLAFGLSFQLPVLMWIITRLGIVEPSFWKKNFAYALVVFAVYGALITPDGSGVTMWFVALPMMLLYGSAYLVVRRMKPKTEK